jgi:hypothetical protein
LDLKEENIQSIMLQATGIDGLIKALEIEYGSLVPLYHATTTENYEHIQKEGLKIMEGKNYLSFSRSSQLYFQIGKSDYVDDHRSILLKFDAPLDLIEEFAYADLDNVDTNDEELLEHGVDINQVSSDMADFIRYFVWNGMKLEGMEIILRDEGGEGIGEIWTEIVKI